jgi:hypothetical protein
MSTAIATGESQREMLEAQLAGDKPPRGGAARLAKLDQVIAELKAQLKAAAALEKSLWSDLWKTPQAVAWDKLGYTREVAQYARWKVLGELGDLDAAKEARQLSDRLGLTPLAMLRLQWEIATDELADARAEKEAAPASRKRMRAVDSSR